MPQFLPLMAPPRRAPSPAAKAPAARAERTSGMLLFLYLMWGLNVFDPQWWIASLGPQIALKVPTLLFAVLLVVTILRAPRRLLAPLLVFLAYTLVSLPFAYVRGQAMDVAKALIVYYTLALATMTLVRTAKQAVPIILMALAVQYGVWVVLGARTGQVLWHPAYFNYDSFGPLMVLGMAGLYWVGMATKNRRWRRVAFLVAAGCIVGLVVSFARGAVLSAGVVAFWVWVRSPHKVRTASMGIAALVILAVAAHFYNGAKSAVESGKASTNFWTEMGTSFDPNEGTRQDRQVLWQLARREYVSNPVFGVGPNCFGAYAADHYAAGTVGGQYDENPKTLWGRALHNTYFQLLSEFGTVGAAIFLWMVWDFFRLNRKLRHQRRRETWAAQSGGQLDLRYLSFGLEASMLAFLLTAYFYNQIFDVHWFYTLLTINALLVHLTRPNGKGAPARARGAAGAPALAMVGRPR